jgi:hypothetical protein
MKAALKDLGMKQYVPVSKLAVVLAMVFLIVLVGNGVTGFTTSLIKLQEAASNATQTRTVYEGLVNQTRECANVLNKTSIMFSSCRTDLEARKTENTMLARELYNKDMNTTTYMNSVAALQQEVKKLESVSNRLATDLCCLKRYVLEDDTIRYYYTRGNKTFCVSQPDDVLETVEFTC